MSKEKLILGNQEVDASFLNVEMTWTGMRNSVVFDQVGQMTPTFYFEMVKGTTLNGYLSPEDLRSFCLACANRLLADRILLKKLVVETEITAQAVRDYALENKDNLAGRSSQELAELLLRIRERQAACSSAGVLIAWSDIFSDITQKTLDVLSLKKTDIPTHVCSKILTTPAVKSLTEQAVTEITDSTASDDELLSRYFWLNQGYIGRGLTSQELIPVRNEKNNEENLIGRQELINQLGLSEEEVGLFDIVRDLIYAKSLRADSRQFLQVVSNQIVDLLAEKLKIDAKYLESLTALELKDFVMGNNSIIDKIDNRYQHSLIEPVNLNEYRILVGADVEKFLQETLELKDHKEITQIEGQVANPGVVRGKAKLVFGPQHIIKVNDGDILVSTATSPQLLPAMKKAAAFITDIGGITSHAAIVSRELKKPCIVGTKIATQVLKDGDFVEVDADQGIVKIIK